MANMELESRLDRALKPKTDRVRRSTTMNLTEKARIDTIRQLAAKIRGEAIPGNITDLLAEEIEKQVYKLIGPSK